MIFKNQSLFFLLLFQTLTTLPFLLFASNSSKCNQSCGSNHLLPSPFGFSSACQIPLNCTNGKMIIGEFPVRNVDSDNILVKLEAKCNRSITTIHQLFTRNYNPTSHNGILLKNCTTTPIRCRIPSIPVNASFESLDCDQNSKTENSNISCFSNITGGDERSKYEFLSFKKLKRINDCQNLLSSIWMENLTTSDVSLEVQVVQLGWWLEGTCQCSENSECSEIVSPFNGRSGYRCKCKEGFVGDGYLNGLSCRKASSECSPSKLFSGKCRIGVLIGGVIAGACIMITLVLSWCFVRRRYNLKTQKSTKRRISEATGLSGILIHPYKEIEKATNHFSEKQMLGTGAYGTVYSGKLQGDKLVAIKRLKHRDVDSIEQVMNEIKLISFVKHPNLVRLLGCSIEKDEQILVYEFMPNGTLSQHLQRTRGDGLSWPIRLTIATETAQAIAHLHFAIHPPIYHRDIKSSNILLDCNCKSKVADFGLSRIGLVESSHISTAPQGTPGYLDPQYQQDFQLSDKSDVYSFGVVLVEIITALKVVDFSRPQTEVNLAALAIDRIGKGCLDEIIDPLIDLNMDAWTVSSVHKVAELAFRCLAFHRDMRPTMMEVAAELEQIRNSWWINSEESNFTPLSGSASTSSSSNLSEKPLNVMTNKDESESEGLQNLTKGMKDHSPVSVQDPRLSGQSSPSSNSLLSNAI